MDSLWSFISVVCDTSTQVIEDIAGAYFKEEDFDCSELELQVQLDKTAYPLLCVWFLVIYMYGCGLRCDVVSQFL